MEIKEVLKEILEELDHAQELTPMRYGFSGGIETAREIIEKHIGEGEGDGKSNDNKIDGLIEKINEQDFTHHDGDHHWYMTPDEIKERIVDIIKEYCGVEE